MIQLYFVAERLNIGIGNWEQLKALFEGMGTQKDTGEPGDTPVSSFPAYINHWRERLDGDAAIYESQFEPGEVSGAKFRQLLADEFGVDVQDIDQVITQEDYSGIGTVVWTYSYGAVERFIVRRFGPGQVTWEESRQECLGYLKANQAEWETEV